MVLSNTSKQPCHPPGRGGGSGLCCSTHHCKRSSASPCRAGSGVEELAGPLTARDLGNHVLLLPPGAKSAPGGLSAAARVVVSPILALRGQGGAAAPVSRLYRTGVGGFGDLLRVTPGATGWWLQLLGCSCGSGALARAAESCHDPAGGKRCWGTPLAADVPAVSDLAPPAWLGFGKLGWAPIPGIFHLHPDDFQ